MIFEDLTEQLIQRNEELIKIARETAVMGLDGLGNQSNPKFVAAMNRQLQLIAEIDDLLRKLDAARCSKERL